jgi:hypothetical protein
VDEARLLGIGLDFGAQAVDGVIDGTRDSGIGVLPDIAKQIVTANYLAWALGEILQQGKFAVCEVNFFDAPRRGVTHEVNRHIAERQDVRIGT